MKSASLAELTCATFSGLLHSRFQIHGHTLGPVELELVEVTPHPSGQPTTQNQSDDSFSLIFAGPVHQFLAQQMYRFEHDKLGAFDLFIVPIGKEQNGFQYQAIFNRSPGPGR
jgi:hypothetical protein